MNVTPELSHLVDKLTVVLGFCELLLEDCYGKLPQDQRSVIAEVFDAARGAKDIVRSAGGMLSN